MNLDKFTLGELLAHSDKDVRRHAIGALKAIEGIPQSLPTLKKCGRDHESQGIVCPFCGQFIPYSIRDGVHTWSCEYCPFYAIEKY